MTYPFYCNTCQSNFMAESPDIEIKYSLDGHQKSVAYCPTCHAECNQVVSTTEATKQKSDDYLDELMKQYGGGCRGGGCSCG